MLAEDERFADRDGATDPCGVDDEAETCWVEAEEGKRAMVALGEALVDDEIVAAGELTLRTCLDSLGVSVVALTPELTLLPAPAAASRDEDLAETWTARWIDARFDNGASSRLALGETMESVSCSSSPAAARACLLALSS